MRAANVTLSPEWMVTALELTAAAVEACVIVMVSVLDVLPE
jgi:hypothetical protein